MSNKLTQDSFIDELEKQAGGLISTLIKTNPKYFLKLIRSSGIGRNIGSGAIARGVAGTAINPQNQLSYWSSPLKKFVGRTLGSLYRTEQAVTRSAPKGSGFMAHLKGAVNQTKKNFQYSVSPGKLTAAEQVTRPTTGIIAPGKNPKTKLFLNKTPTVKGGNIYSRKPLGMATKFLATGTGLGLAVGATTPGSLKNKTKEGLETTIGWGLFKTPASLYAGAQLTGMVKDIYKTMKEPKKQQY